MKRREKTDKIFFPRKKHIKVEWRLGDSVAMLGGEISPELANLRVPLATFATTYYVASGILRSVLIKMSKYVATLSSLKRSKSVGKDLAIFFPLSWQHCSGQIG